MSRGKPITTRMTTRLLADQHRGYNHQISSVINKEKEDGLYDVFLKSKVKFYRKCIEAGLTDSNIDILMQTFANKERKNRK